MTIQDTCHMMTNETLIVLAKFGTELRDIPSAKRWNVIFARKELNKRDAAATRNRTQ